MSLAEELAKKYRFSVKHGFGAAINEAIERCAADCESQARYHEGAKDNWNKSAFKAFHHAATRLRALRGQP